MSRRTACLIVILLMAVAPARAGDERAEASIKAAIVFNLARVVTWPERALADTFVLEVVGTDDLAPAIAALKDKQVDGRPLQISGESEGTRGQMVFVARSEAERCDALLAACAGQPILTVSEIDGFCERGGIVQLVRRHNRIRLRVNRAAAEAAGLRLGSQLLRVAELVGRDG